MSSFSEFCASLENKIKASYETGTTLEDAERLAAEFLRAQIRVSHELRNADLDSRMRKSGLKSVRAAIYMEASTSADKKPTEAMLAAMVDSHVVVQGAQDDFDKIDVDKASLERYYDIFREAHIYYRGIAKGRFE